jgi:hypothetical protein
LEREPLMQEHRIVSSLPSYLLTSNPEPVNGELEIMYQLNAHLDVWTAKAKQFGELEKFIKIAIKEQSQKLRETYASPSKKFPTKIQLDLAIFHCTLEQVRNINHPINLNDFLNHTRALFSKHIDDAKFLYSLPELNDSFNKLTQNLETELNVVVIGIHHLHSSFNLSSLENAIKGTQTVIEQINSTVLTASDAGQVVQRLLTNAIHHANIDDAVKTASAELENKIKSQAKANEIFAAKQNLNNAIVKQHEQQKSTEQLLFDINKGIGLTAELVKLTGNPKLAHQIAVVGTAAVNITTTILGWAAIAAASGPAAPFIAIGGAVVTLLKGLFGGDGPSKEEQLLMHISKQIAQLAEHIDKRFDRIEEVLVTVDKHILEGFANVHAHLNKISDLINFFYIDSMREFKGIREDINTLKVAIKNVGEKIDHGNLKINQRLGEIYLQRYSNLKSKAVEFTDTHSKDPVRLESETKNALIEFSKIATDTSANLTSDKDNDLTTLCTYISKGGIEFNINLLLAYLRNNHGIALTSVVNPLIWQDAVQNYMNLVFRTPCLVIGDTQIKQINSMCSAGNDLKKAILAIKTNEQLFHNLCENYRQNIKNLLTIIYQLEIIPNKTSLQFLDGQRKSQRDSLFTYLNSIQNEISKNSQRMRNSITHAKNKLVKLLATSRTPKETLEEIYLLDVIKNELLGLWGHNWVLEDYDTRKGIRLWNTVANGLFKPGLQVSRGDFGRLLPSNHGDIVNSIIPALKLIIISECAASSINNIELEPIARSYHLSLMKEFFKVIDPLTFNMQINSAVKSDDAIKTALENLTTAHTLLSIFVSFAFPEEYANDFILRDYLQNQLWNGHVFTNYVKYYATQSSDFIAFVLEKNVLDSVDKFENFLLSKILKARIEKNVDYPLLCDTLKDLETFKSSCEIMYAPTIVRAPGSPLHFKPKPSEAGTTIIAKDATIVAGLAKMEG